MEDNNHRTLVFLADMGIKASIITDDEAEKLIVIATKQFVLRRIWVESGYILIAQAEDYCSTKSPILFARDNK